MTQAMPIEALDEHLRGDVVRPGDTDYDASRRVYNAMIDRRPALIVRCRDAADVIDALAYARRRGLAVAVRGGGHSAPGFGVCDGGMVLDMSPMKWVRVDPDRRIAEVGPGCVWGDVDHATHAFGLATVSGILSTTGVGGLTLGGGHGYLSRKYGLTIDNLASADVVLADGHLVHASEWENPDLFWALRGGGGNFGVVTSFELRLHPVDVVHAGMTVWAFEETAEVMRWYREMLPRQPEDVYGFFGILDLPPAPPFPEALHGRRACAVTWCYCGPDEGAEAAFAPVRDAPEPLLHHVGPMPYPALQSMFDGFYPTGLQWYWKGAFVRDLSDAAIQEHVAHGAKLPSSLSTMHLYPIDGAVHRVPPDATAFRYRDVTWSQVIVGVHPEASMVPEIRAWARDYWQALAPHTLDAAYVNFMMQEGDARIRATYGENHDRLAQIKTKYDPRNVFHLNQNIEPRRG